MNIFIISAIAGCFVAAFMFIAARCLDERGNFEWGILLDGWCWTCVIATVILAIIGALNAL